MSKKCSRCKLEKELAEFKDRKRKYKLKDGTESVSFSKRPECKDCSKLAAKETRERHIDSYRAKQRERSERPEVKAAKKARMKQYRLDTKEHIKAYYRKNREHILTQIAEYQARPENIAARKEYLSRPDVKASMAAQSRQWGQDNPISRHILTALAHDRVKERVGDIDKTWALEQLEMQNCRCAYCAIELKVTAYSFSLSQASIERIDNSKAHTKTNCIITCVFCNRARNQGDQGLYIQFADALQTGHVPEELLENTQAILDAPDLRSHAHSWELKKGGEWSDFITAGPISNGTLTQCNGQGVSINLNTLHCILTNSC